MQIIEKLSTKIYSFFHSEKGYLDEGVVICIMTIFACLIILFCLQLLFIKGCRSTTCKNSTDIHNNFWLFYWLSTSTSH